ncbi:Zinc transporter of isoform 1 [Hibiscus syriacus]|uniref:Zinc transporter of isoform 1 n=1 Tax=Hibiscus syriacus TaxID=106335 RepID=A0A6A2ZYX6_HIBSY|nr:Zinc transporter of isoform 1 [Hibiscus syriacus]
MLGLNHVPSIQLINLLISFSPSNCSLKFLGEHLEVECLEQGFGEEGQFSTPSFEERMPFLQMLQCVESPQHFAFKEPNFQTLLRLQHLKKPWELNTILSSGMETQIQALELESCVTHEILFGLHSPVKSETKDLRKSPPSGSCFEVPSSGSNQDQASHQWQTTVVDRQQLGSSPLKNFPNLLLLQENEGSENEQSSQASVLYSFNLKMEDDSELRSADEIAAAIHQIFAIQR